MRVFLAALAMVVGVAITERAHANGVAICIAMAKNSSFLVFTDVEYFLRHDDDPEKTGWDARRAARKDTMRSTETDATRIAAVRATT